MSRTSDAACALGKRRWACSTAAERKAFSDLGASKGGTAAWAGMTEAERSAEMRRRAAVRRRKAR